MNQLKGVYCDVDEAAGELKVHPESVRRLIRQGRLKAVKVGMKWMINRAYLLQYARVYDPRKGNGPKRIRAELRAVCPLCNLGDTKERPMLLRDHIGRFWHQYCAEKALSRWGGDDAS